MAKYKLEIEGMTCQSCVAKVTKAIMNSEGTHDIEVNLREQRASFTLDERKGKLPQVLQAIERAGYSVSQKKGEKKGLDWFYVWGILAFVVVLVLSKQVTKFIPALDQGGSYSYLLVFLIGILTSFHCIGMCGGISISQGASGQSFRLRSTSLIQYHVGRIFSYTLVGGILGGVGAVAAPSDSLRGVVTLLGGVGMLLFALSGLAPRWFSRIHLPEVAAARERAGRIFGYSSWGVGFINGFVPCGPLQGMQLFALGSGSVLQGGLTMLIFSLGTVPLLFGFGTAVSVLNPKIRTRLVKLGLLFVVFLGVMMTMRGLSFLRG